MDDAGLNPKKMARSKRASSQRSRARHSKHGGAGTSAPAPRLKSVEEALPSNWERYEEASGSDDPDAKPQVEGEVPRPKSKGADYAELLSSEVPKLYEEPQKPEGMVALLLANGLGLTDWDCSYLEPASSSDWQAAQEASALLHLDLDLLGKSLSRLHVSERLLLEEDLFPKQELEEDDGSDLHNILEVGADSPDTERTGLDSFGPAVGGIGDPESSRAKIRTQGSTVVDNVNHLSKPLPDDRKNSQYRPPNAKTASEYSARNFETGALHSGPAHVSSSFGDIKAGSSAETGKGIAAAVGRVKIFEATDAEAELDELLDMLDSHVAGVPLNVDSKAEGGRVPSAGSNVPALWPSNPSISNSAADFRPQETTRKAPSLGGPLGLPPTSSSTSAQIQKHFPPSQDDDFDEWLDSL